MSTLAVIPARLGATRLPRKPLRLLAGSPLVVRVWERIAAIRAADACIIATDSDEVVQVARAAGAECVLTDSGHASGTDRVADVANRAAFRGFDVIVNVQGDEPFVSEAAVRGAMHLVCDGAFSMATAAAPAALDALAAPDVVKVVTATDGRALYFSRAPIPHLRDEADAVARASLIRQHVGVYAYTREALSAWVALPPHPLERVERLEQLRALAAGFAMGVAQIPGPVMRGIDTEIDLAEANARWPDFSAGRM